MFFGKRKRGVEKTRKTGKFNQGFSEERFIPKRTL